MIECTYYYSRAYSHFGSHEFNARAAQQSRRILCSPGALQTDGRGRDNKNDEHACTRFIITRTWARVCSTSVNYNDHERYQRKKIRKPVVK